ncbi:MAG: hypothetical protein Aurels2KO_21690 [Aureliella sp.]
MMARYRIPDPLALELSDLAEFVADHYCPQSHVKPEVIARENGISVSYNDYGDDFDGMLEHRSGKFHIYVNTERNKVSTRQRFTLCHELAHFYIDSHRIALQSGQTPVHKSQSEFQSDNPVEIEADFFACSLLLPEKRFRKRAKSKAPGLPVVLDAAEQFKASVSASAIRYVSLGIHEAILVKWNKDDQYHWRRIGQSPWEKGYRNTIKAVHSLPKDSATTRAMNGEQPDSGAQFHTSTTMANVWFPTISASSLSANIILNEHAMRLGKYGTITVLTPYEHGFHQLIAR